MTDQGQGWADRSRDEPRLSAGMCTVQTAQYQRLLPQGFSISLHVHTVACSLPTLSLSLTPAPALTSSSLATLFTFLRHPNKVVNTVISPWPRVVRYSLYIFIRHLPSYSDGLIEIIVDRRPIFAAIPIRLPISRILFTLLRITMKYIDHLLMVVRWKPCDPVLWTAIVLRQISEAIVDGRLHAMVLCLWIVPAVIQEGNQHTAVLQAGSPWQL